jgi:ribosomal protein S12 methylthiotransferase accessory factor
VESYHAEHITLPLRYGSYAELSRRYRLADVTTLLRSDGSLFHYERPLLWIEAFDLGQDEHVWLPYELVHTDYTLDSSLSPGNFAASSNGVASGNHLLEAISHAICEVVERDATTLWTVMSEEEQDKRRLALSTVDDPGCCEVLEKYGRAGIAVGVWETTTDIGLPAFECKIVDRESTWHRNLYAAKGAGCHPTRHIALLRALTEAAQSRAAYIAGSRDDMFRENYERASAPVATDLHRQWAGADGQRDFHDVPTWEGETLDEDVAWELKRLRGAGFEHVQVVDLTKEEFGIPVVRVVIPGLECKGVIPNCVYGPRAQAVMGGGV